MIRRSLKEKVKNYYTIYGKNDAVIASGSSEECARQLGITRPSFYTMVSKFQKGKQYQRYSAVVVDDEEFTEQEEEDI